MQLRPNTSWLEACLIYAKPKVIGLAFLGFSAGLPFLLVFSTLSAWLREADISRSTIGLFSWIGITYSIKFVWAPVVDRLNLPFLTHRFGKRRSWMLSGQLGIALGLIAMSDINPTSDLYLMAFCALLVAFASATQDIALDAFRIESADDDHQAAMAASYVFGYRIALLVAGGGALLLADQMSWSQVYLIMAALMLVGITTTLIMREPIHQNQDAWRHEEQVLAFLARNPNKTSTLKSIYAWIIGAVICPFTDFIRRYGHLAFYLLLLIGAYKISDITMGVMANPFYLDMGYSKSEIGAIVKGVGFGMTLFGAALGGVLVVRYGIMGPLLLGAALIAITNFIFAVLALSEPNRFLLTAVISADNLSGGIATTVFIAFLSSLTSTRYTATQYALFSSFMTLPGKSIGGFAGFIVDAEGYFNFFIYAAALGIPAMLLIIFLIKKRFDASVSDRQVENN